MKYSNFPAFEKHLEGASEHNLAEVYLILAKDAFVRKQAIDRVTSFALKKEMSPELCIHAFDAEQHSAEFPLAELGALSFFAKQRVVVIQNVDAYDKNSTTKLETYFASPNRSVCLVLAAVSVNRATNFYKKAEKLGVVLDIAEEKPWEREKTIAEWLRVEANAQGKQISPQACQILVKQLGVDQSLLHNELLKLACYVGSKSTIDERDIAAVCTSINLDTGWQLGEAIFRRDAASALRIAKALLADGAVLIALLRQIRSQFQTEYQICSILTRGGAAADITAQFPYMKGTILDRHLKQAQTYGMQRFKQGILAIDETELSSKNSVGNPDFLLELLLIKLTQ